MHINNIKISAFGLIEVMISALILSISLLGVAALQSRALYTVVEAGRKETAYQMISQLTNYALNAPNNIGDLANPTISGTTDVAGCYTASGCPTQTFYKSTVEEWQNILSTMLPNGKGCACLTSGVTLSPTPQTVTMLVAVNWKNLSGLYTTIALSTQIPSATSSSSTTVTACNNPSQTTPATTSAPLGICNTGNSGV
ncbi:MAG: hypothetical protein ABSA84_06445 [Gammaproteobacteria bacterium]